MLSAKPWQGEHVIRLLLYLFLGLAIVSVVMDLGRRLIPGETIEGLMFFFGTLGVHVSALTAVHFFLRNQGSTWSEGFGFRTFPSRALRLGVISSLLIIPIALLINGVCVYVYQKFAGEVSLQPAVKVLEETNSLVEQAGFALLAVIGAPIVEEVLFRGILYPLVKQRGFPRLALYGSAVVFAAVHGHGLTFLPLAFLGVALAVLYESADNLLAPIAAHAIFNAANFAWLVST
ncbi:MAG TPA: CPBP family intramembrane glutamic endopeptidase [Methylomirabilota bacterium]|nr:CPBP family intramembrane glutamic endopeptidase [Methylomirabilota bacterium]